MSTRKTHNNYADTASNPGTGTFTLLGGIPSSPTLLIAPRVATGVLADQDAPDYIAVDSADNTKWEEGYGTYTASGTTLTRTLLDSSTGSLINFTGTVNIYFSLNVGGLLPASGVIGANPMTTTGDIIKGGTVAGGVAAPVRVASGTAWTVAQTLVDLGAACGVVVNDQNIGATLIAATSKPGSPQWTYTVQASDIPSNQYIQDYACIIQFYGKNTDAVSSQVVNWRLTKNGSDVGSSDGSKTVTNNQFWAPGSSNIIAVNCLLLASTALVAGDVIGMKLWATNANQLDYRGATLYFIPRILNVPLSGDVGAITRTSSGSAWLNTAAFIGALSGVTYSTTGMNFNQPPNNNAPFLSAISNTVVNNVGGSALLVTSPDQFCVGLAASGAAFADFSTTSANSTAAATLNGIATNNLYRYFRRIQVTT